MLLNGTGMLLKRLTECSGVSGREGEVRNVIRSEVADETHEITIDALGNLLVREKHPKEGPRVMLAAHMDEIGLMITFIEKSGYLRFRPVGAIDERVLVSKSVIIGKDRIPGVIGAKPIHLQEPEEREKPLKVEQLYIDIGSKSKEETEKAAKPGDLAVFATKYEEIGEGCAKAKAFDDRIGCAVLIEVLKASWPFPVFGAFTAQEEVGARGATVAAYSVEPDLALVIEGTTASDVPGTKGHGYSSCLGKGPVLSYVDPSLIASRPIIRRLFKVADKEGIAVQTKRLVSGATDAGRIHLAREGVPSVVVSSPCRYIHSPASVVNLSDFENTKKLVFHFLKSIEEEGVPV